jgi:hypothetical protein
VARLTLSSRLCPSLRKSPGVLAHSESDYNPPVARSAVSDSRRAWAAVGRRWGGWRGRGVVVSSRGTGKETHECKELEGQVFLGRRRVGQHAGKVLEIADLARTRGRGRGRVRGRGGSRGRRRRRGRG